MRGADGVADETTGTDGTGDDIDVSSIRLLELRHRIKNLLAIVQAVANQTLRSGRSIEEARVALDGRLAAMGAAVDMLLSTGWTDGGLRELIGRALIGGDPRISLDGPDVVLGPDAVMALTLVFHELESNAIKYGALSAADGRVAIGWSVEAGERGARLRLEWAEHDGPPCVPPARKGFGSRMMAKLVGGRLRGSAETEYRPEGLCWRLSAPLAALAP
ncbi:MAG TPA: sensor histidine kinase [Allosphingosinicella sp.]|jgi:two-component sensor histidine kinase